MRKQEEKAHVALKDVYKMWLESLSKLTAELPELFSLFFYGPHLSQT